MDLMTLAMLKALGGGSGGGSVAEKSLGQRGFIYNTTSISNMSGTAPDYYVSVGSSVIGINNASEITTYVPEAGSMFAVKAPSSGIVSNATLKFRANNYYSTSWPIYYGTAAITEGKIDGGNVILLSFNGKRFYVAGVVRDPVNVPTKLSDLENDLNLSGIEEIDLSSAAQSLDALLSVNKTAITGASGEKTTFYWGNTFASAVYAVGSAFSDKRLPVVSLGEWAKLPVIAIQSDAEADNRWFSVKMSETEASGTSLFGYTHEIVVALVGVVIHTQKYEIDVQTLPSS